MKAFIRAVDRRRVVSLSMDRKLHTDDAYMNVTLNSIGPVNAAEHEIISRWQAEGRRVKVTIEEWRD